MINNRWKIKSECHFPYTIRGNGPKEAKWAVKYKTDFGRFLIKFRKNTNVNVL